MVYLAMFCAQMRDKKKTGVCHFEGGSGLVDWKEEQVLDKGACRPLNLRRICRLRRSQG